MAAWVSGGFFLPTTGHTQAGLPNPAFNSPVANSPARSVAVQSNGRIVVGGAFTEIGGQPRSRLARLTSNGSLEAGFAPQVSDPRFADPEQTQPMRCSVDIIRIQSDGKILIGGDFYQVNGQIHLGVARLNSNGTLDTVFSANSPFYRNEPAEDAHVHITDMVLQSNGKIIVAGIFAQEGGVPTEGPLMRLNADGSRDTSFQPPASLPISPEPRVAALVSRRS